MFSMRDQSSTKRCQKKKGKRRKGERKEKQNKNVYKKIDQSTNWRNISSEKSPINTVFQRFKMGLLSGLTNIGSEKWQKRNVQKANENENENEKERRERKGEQEGAKEVQKFEQPQDDNESIVFPPTISCLSFFTRNYTVNSGLFRTLEKADSSSPVCLARASSLWCTSSAQHSSSLPPKINK